MADLSYPYKPKSLSMVWAVLFFGVCCFIGWHGAASNKPTIILGFRLSADQAHVVFEVLAAISALFVVGAIAMFFLGIFSSHRLTLTATEISAPKTGFSRRTTVVPLVDIEGTDLQTIRSQRFLNIYHRNGKLTIMQSLLPNANAFEQICSALSNRSSG